MSLRGVCGRVLRCTPTHYRYAPLTTTSAELVGAPAATYEMPGGDVRLAMLGIASLRSNGLEDSTLRAVHIALAASNRSDEHWTVDASEARLSMVVRRERSDIYATTLEVGRAPVVDVPPRSTRMIDLYFPLPIQLANKDALPSFEVLWTVHAGTRTITERTPFQRTLSAPAVEEPRRFPGDLFDREQPLPGSELPDRKYVPPLDD